MAFSHVPSGLTRRNMYTPSRKDSTTTLPRISVAGKKNIMPFLRPKSFKKIDSTPLYTKNDPNIVLSRTQTASIAMRMRVSQRELKKLKKCFDKIDFECVFDCLLHYILKAYTENNSGSGSIDYWEFYDFLQEPKTVFSERLFEMIEMNNDGTIDLEEFVHAMILFCTFSREEMLQFAFNIFDTERSGFIRCRECQPLTALVNPNGSLFPGNMKNVFSVFDRNDGILDYKEFKALNTRLPLLLFPCFRLQETMQKCTLGRRQWINLRQKAEAMKSPERDNLPKLSVMKSFRKLLGKD